MTSDMAQRARMMTRSQGHAMLCDARCLCVDVPCPALILVEMQSLCNDELQKAVSGLRIGGAVSFDFIECRHLVCIELHSHLLLFSKPYHFL